MRLEIIEKYKDRGILGFICKANAITYWKFHIVFVMFFYKGRFKKNKTMGPNTLAG